jgi:hypothetical protein
LNSIFLFKGKKIKKKKKKKSECVREIFYCKFNVIFLIILFCSIIKVRSEEEDDDKDKTTIYVTVTANSTTEEATPTKDETIPTSTVEIEKLPEYIKFEDALKQTEDQCMKHVYVVSLNLFHANQIGNVDCGNGHFSSLESLRKAKPCKNNPKLQYAIEYMDANIRLMCHTYSTGTYTYEGKQEKKLCPIIQLMKTNYTKYEENLFDGCKKNDTCIEDILKDYKSIERIRTKLKEIDNDDEKVSYKINGGNETVFFKMNITDSIFKQLESKCPTYINITSSALSVTISFSTLIAFSIFMIFIGRM